MASTSEIEWIILISDIEGTLEKRMSAREYVDPSELRHQIASSRWITNQLGFI